MDRDLIQSGTWSAGSGSNSRTLGFTTLGIQNGATFRTDSEERVAMNVNVLPDGTASVFTRTSERPMVATQPKPAPGFQARDGYDALKRKMDAAIGS